MFRRVTIFILAISTLFLSPTGFAQDKPYTFIAIGDTGCACSGQEKISKRLIEWHRTNPFSTVLLLGDNVYGSIFGTRGGNRALFEKAFDRYFLPLTKSGVKFHATLGNHDLETRDGADEIADRKRFNILGPQGYYSFFSDAKIDGKPLVLFISLNSPALIERDAEDRAQIAWLSKTLASNGAVWKVIYFHHPLYAPSGEGHEPELELRRDLEDVFVAAGVQLVLAGHNHYYARMKTQRGITHFISGGGGRSLKEPIVNQYTERVAEAYHFIHFDVYADRMEFRTIPPSGKILDSGTIPVAPPGGGNPPVVASKPGS